MTHHDITIRASAAPLARADQLAWKLASRAAGKPAVNRDVTSHLINRLIAAGARAVQSVNTSSAIAARGAALAHLKKLSGAQMFGVPSRITASPEWAAWANGMALYEPEDPVSALIAPLLAVAQAFDKTGKDLIRGLAAAAETLSSLTHSLPLAPTAHLAPAGAAGIGALLGLKPETIFRAIQQAACVSPTTQGAAAEPAFAAAHAGKLAIEAVDRALRGGQAPSLVYEGASAALLGGVPPDLSLPAPHQALLELPPASREDQIARFLKLTGGIITTRESNRFLETVQNLPRLTAGELAGLNVALPAGALEESKPGIF